MRGKLSQSKSQKLVERIFDPCNGLLLFCLALGVVYGIAPMVLSVLFSVGKAFTLLSVITFYGIAAMIIGAKIPMLDHRFTRHAIRLFIPSLPFNLVVWTTFILFVIGTFSTAPSIPLISALGGVSADELSQERGDFLKGRQGVAIALLYLSTFLVNTVIPYSIVLLYHIRSRSRHIAALIFLLFCISFMQKTLFLNLILPLLAYFSIVRKLRGGVFKFLLGGSILILITSIFLSGFGEAEYSGTSEPGEYFSARYAPSSPLDYLLWRVVSVPIFTATDTLVVHTEQFDEKPLMGATSSLISGILGVERINLERYVFQHQFGSWNEIANANAVFFVDAYVNFGWLGVGIFGAFVGLVFRWFHLSRDIAFKSLWPLFAFILFSAPLIGMILSNGFAYMLIHALIIRVGHHDKNTN